MILNAVEWIAFVGGLGVLLALVGFLLRDRLFGIDRRHAKEVAAREAGDVELAKLIKEITQELNSHKVKDAEERADNAVLHSKVSDLEKWMMKTSESLSVLRDGSTANKVALETICKKLDDIKEDYVTREFCESRHG